MVDLELVRGSRGLVVDDDPVQCMLARECLEGLGFEVRVASSGEAAIGEAREWLPDLVLLDVDMPGMDGFDTTLALRRMPGGEELTILMATGLSDGSSIERAYEVGVTDFVSKPVDWQLLRHRVRFLLRASDAFSELHRTLSDLRASQQRLANAQRLARMGNWEWDPETGEMLLSAELCRLLEIATGASDTGLDDLLCVVHPDDRDELEKAIHDLASRRGDERSFEHRVQTPSGRRLVVLHQMGVAASVTGDLDRIAGTLHDVTDRHRAEERVRFLANFDTLTGLPNRRLLDELLDRAIDRARKRSESIAVMHLGLDRFDRVHDTLGPVLGDSLLQTIAQRLTESVRAHDVIAHTSIEPIVSRRGADEFTVILPGIGSPMDAAQAARRLLDNLALPIPVSGHDIVMSSSIGIALYPRDGEDAHALVKHASAAMHHARRSGTKCYRFFSDAINETAMRNLTLENALRAALERDELELHFQPQIDAASHAIVGAEALLRWNSTSLGPVSPAEVIPVAEASGLIHPVTEWVLRRACTQARSWQHPQLRNARVALNVSSHQIHDADFVRLVRQTLAETGLEPERLEIEITESALIGDAPTVVRVLDEIHDMGVRLALDDFGTGYSSLSHLFRFPIDIVKIDRTFVAQLGRARRADELVSAVITMAHHLSLEVVAEGVETQAQEAFLHGAGCDHLQGFRFWKPVPQQMMLQRLAEQDPTDD